MDETLAVVGIDLGTTFACAGCLKNGKIEIIANNYGERTTPSFVSYERNSSAVHVGKIAVQQLSKNAQNTIFDSKRLIGKLYGDKSISSDIEKFPFKVIQQPDSNQSGMAVFELAHDAQYLKESNKKNWVSPEEVASEILKSLKKSAERFIGGKVKHAVITVPAYFTNEQRIATKKAGELAGLEVLRLLSEPTAAALAYGESGSQSPTLSQTKDAHDSKPKTILVFDLGGGTFDVSLLTFQNHTYDVKAVEGDGHLGGEDFTNYLIDYFLNFFASESSIPKEQLLQNHRVMRRLRDQCEQVKRILSFTSVAHIELENLAAGFDLYKSISREEFESITSSLFSRLTNPIDAVLHTTNTPKSQVDEIVLIGGATRMPKIKEIIQTYFPERDIKETVNPDEAVAYGATVMAVKLARTLMPKNETELILNKIRELPNEEAPAPNIVVNELTPFAISRSLFCDLAEIIIPQNTKIPVSFTNTVATSRSFQTEISFHILEGESRLAERNNLLGLFTISNLTSRLRGETKISYTMTIDLDNILTVSGYELDVSSHDSSSYNRHELVIENIANTLSTEERLGIPNDIEYDLVADEMECERREAKAAFYKELDDMLIEIDEIRLANGRLTPNEIDISKELEGMRFWFDKNLHSAKDQYLSKTVKLMNVKKQFEQSYMHRVSGKTRENTIINNGSYSDDDMDGETIHIPETKEKKSFVKRLRLKLF